MSFRRWAPALLLLASTHAIWADEPGKAKSPPDAKPKVDKAVQHKPLEIPFRLTNTSHILVRVKINGKGPFNFIVDTGAPIMILAAEAGKKIGLATDKSPFVKLDRVEIEGGAVLEKFPCLVETPFQIEGMNAMGLAGRELHGMLGYTVLARFRMEIDLTKDKMIWTPLDYSPPPPMSSGGKGGQGGLEILGTVYRLLGAIMGVKKTPEPVARGFLGIELKEGGDSVSIAGVLAKSRAAEAGLKVGDQIMQINSKMVRSSGDVSRFTAEIAAGQPLLIVVRRGGEKLDIRLAGGDGL